jgi:hypothetical protein
LVSADANLHCGAGMAPRSWDATDRIEGKWRGRNIFSLGGQYWREDALAWARMQSAARRSA